MLVCMDGHTLLSYVAICASVVSDEGPRRYRQSGRPLPEKYLPGRYLAGRSPVDRATIVRAAKAPIAPAPWFLRHVIQEEP